MNLFNRENTSISIILKRYATVLIYPPGVLLKYCFIFSLSNIRFNPIGLIWGKGTYCKNWAKNGSLLDGGLNQGEGAQSRTYSMKKLVTCSAKSIATWQLLKMQIIGPRLFWRMAGKYWLLKQEGAWETILQGECSHKREYIFKSCNIFDYISLHIILIKTQFVTITHQLKYAF